MEHIAESPGESPVTCSVHDWQALRSQLLFVYDSPIEGRAEGTHERHGEYSAWLVRRGQATLKSGGETIQAGPGQWVFCFGQRITQKFSADAHLLSVRVLQCWPDGTLLFSGDRLLLQLEAADYPQLEALAVALHRDVGSTGWQRDHPSYVLQWQTRLNYPNHLQQQLDLLQWHARVADIVQQHGWELRIPRGIDPRLARTLDLLDNLPFEAPYPSERIAEGSGVSIGQLNRMCQRAYNLTLYGYWEQRRIQHARWYVVQPTLSIKRIALMLGFKQLSHFSLWFKRHMGLSPRDYRKNHGMDHVE